MAASRTSRRTPRLSRRLLRAKPGQDVVGWFGGHPRGIRHHEWPRCRVCDAPMCHMGQINAGEWLNIGPYRRMSLFICHATGGRCEDWDAWKGANRVLLQTTLDDNLHDGPPTVRVYKRVKLTVSQPLDEATFLKTARKQKMSARDVRSALRHDKLGGMPVWLQGDATPKGVDGRKMRMLMQVTTEVVKFDITPTGVGYVYFDPSEPEEHAARLLWQGE